MSIDPPFPQPRPLELATLVQELSWVSLANDQDAIVQRLAERLFWLTRQHPVTLYRRYPGGNTRLVCQQPPSASRADGNDQTILIPQDPPHWGYASCRTENLTTETLPLLRLWLDISGQRLRYLTSLRYEHHRQQLKAKRRLIVSEIRQMQDADTLVARHGDHWLSLLHAQGVALMLNDRHVVRGMTPTASALSQLKTALSTMQASQHIVTLSDLPDHASAALPSARHGGALAIRMTVADLTLGWMVLFRLHEPEHQDGGVDVYLPSGWLASDVQIAQDLADDIAVALSVIDIMHANRKLISSNDQLKRLAHRDPLTGCWNRYRLDLALTEVIAQSTCNGDSLFLLLIDIDDFKSINDQHGHMVGDEIIAHVAALIRKQLRHQDGWGRWGGEEFMVIIPRVTHARALKMAERLCDAIAQSPCPAPVQGVTISIGVARWQPGLGHRQLIERADDAMYRAKRSGKNRVESAEERAATEARGGGVNPTA
ncbi:diguanylate cyclase [Halomonas sp. ML-15]|uniref:sensor domain-containing diguanylate cyclase n=1 Tax=Halomonas sp. ML-15 TaxID=2773305 RepID=UPI001747191E|nr:sensor domain-containing diguanylate cyclase [Halomonas sp. ML-15]MBD3896690.1 diguanylate cyclase [Halomonas sp. ML-15]